MKISQSYNSKYSEKKLYWGRLPHKLVVATKKYLPQGATILDLGCGEGQNAGYLAKNGFKVAAIDISEAGIKKTKTIARQKNIPIETKVADIIDYLKDNKTFTAIICLNVLQFIPADKIQFVIKKLQAKTAIGGYNIIASFIAPNIKQKQKAIFLNRYLFSKNELKRYYSNWNILKYVEKLSRWETHNEPKHRHHIVGLIARKEK